MKHLGKFRARRAIPTLAALGLGAAVATQAFAGSKVCESPLTPWSQTAGCTSPQGEYATSAGTYRYGIPNLVVNFRTGSSYKGYAWGHCYDDDGLTAGVAVYDNHADGKTVLGQCDPDATQHRITIVRTW